jgi:hypothetical protein
VGARGGTPQAITLQPRLCVQACVGIVCTQNATQAREAERYTIHSKDTSTGGHAVQAHANKENMRGRRSQGAETQPPRVDLLGGAKRPTRTLSVFCDFLWAPQVNHFRRLLESDQSDQPNRTENCDRAVSERDVIRARPPVLNFFVLDQMNRTEPNRLKPMHRTERYTRSPVRVH